MDTINTNHTTTSENISQSSSYSDLEGISVTGDENTPLCNNWDDFDIKPNLLRGIYAIGFEKPSPIQQKAIIPIISRRDIIAQAQSGTGKTATFSIGTLQVIDTSIPRVQAILMAPTHELARQSASVIGNIGSMMKDLIIQTLVGGTSVYDDANLLKNNTPHVIVGTPGRVYDMIKRNHLDTQYIRIFVMDEADDMLSAGFKDQIYNIFQYLPNEVQVALFSATMPTEIVDLSKRFMRNPVKILMKTEELTLECIKQYYIALSSDNTKYEMLKNLFSYITVSQCIIYVNSVNRVVELYNAMCEEGFSVCCIHSSMSKSERDESFRKFKSGNYRVLISSNITARGIDIQQVSIVINFDIPRCVHTYLHRIGRGGRWGRKGTAINFVTKSDIEYMKKIETHYKISIEEFPLDNASVCKPI